MSFIQRILRWFVAQRQNTRLAFLLQISSRVLMSVCSLIWTPLLVSSMGKHLNGLFLSFQGLATLGGLGDLGIGGAINLQTSRLLGQGKEQELKRFLAAARGAFLIVAAITVMVFVVAAPSAFKSLGFHDDPNVGPIPFLVIAGALAVGCLVLNSYIANLSYGCGNIIWSIIPTFVLTQSSVLAHWLLARQHMPLWLQYSPYVAATVLMLTTNWFFVRKSHPGLADIFPLQLKGREMVDLIGRSFWVYLYCLAAGISITISRLLINYKFGAEMVPVYQYNFRLCELALFVVNSASLASMPKITQWLAAHTEENRQRGIAELTRLNRFQTFLGCGAVMVYLIANDAFIRFWLGKDFHAPLAWQVAFAAHLGITAAGFTGFELASRCCDHGVRVGGIAAVLAGLLNFVLAYVAAQYQSILGIALSGVVAQTSATLFLGWFSSKQIGISWWQLSVKNWLLALVMVGFGLAAKFALDLSPGVAVLAIGLIALTALIVTAKVIGMTVAELRREITIVQSMFGRKQPSNPH